MNKPIYITSEEAEIIAFLIEEELMTQDEIPWSLNKEQLEKLLMKFIDLI